MVRLLLLTCSQESGNFCGNMSTYEPKDNSCEANLHEIGNVNVELPSAYYEKDEDGLETDSPGSQSKSVKISSGGADKGCNGFDGDGFEPVSGLEFAQLQDETSEASGDDYYEVEGSVLDWSVHSEYIPVSKKSNGPVLRSKSTSDIIPWKSTSSSSSREYNAQNLWRRGNEFGSDLSGFTTEEEDMLSIRSEVLTRRRSTKNDLDFNTPFKSKSTSDLDAYLKEIKSNLHCRAEREGSVSEFYERSVSYSCSWYSISDSVTDNDWDWDTDSDTPSSSTSLSYVEQYLSRGNSNPEKDEFLIPIHLNKSLQRSFSQGDLTKGPYA